MKVTVIILALATLSGCIHRNIEYRCLKVGLDIKELLIEETFTGDQKARVICSKEGE